MRDAREHSDLAVYLARQIVLCFSAFLALLAISIPASSQLSETRPKTSEAHSPGTQAISIVFAREIRDAPPPLSLLDFPPEDEGLAGARLAINDNNTTGRFLKQEFDLNVIEAKSAGDLVEKVTAQVDSGSGFVIADASAQTLHVLAQSLEGKSVLILNTSSGDDRLREENCRSNLMHTAPSRAMLTDGLAQYLVWKQWRRWFLIYGTEPDDLAYADAMRRAAKRFGAKIVEERAFKYEVGNRRADGGYEQVQQQIPTFTQNVPDHDMVIVADESQQFGEYIPYRTWDARPVAGTQGLVPASWHAALEQWGATQFQNRFRKLANRPMLPLDYNAWIAVRSVGEAATRIQTTDPKKLIAYIKSPEFDVAGFKGRKLNFRSWDGQLRQPILVSTDKLPVTISPQPGFLHQFSELDTLGVDKPESKCTSYQ